MRVKILKVWPDTKQTKRGTIWGAQCNWEGHSDERISFFFQPQPDAEYEAEVEPREYQGKTYYTIRKAQAAGAQPASGTINTAGGAPVAGYSAAAYKALDSLIGREAQEFADNEDALKSTAYGCMWISMSKDPKVMAEMEAVKEGAPAQGSSSPPPSEDDLGPDENIPF